jgi:hypothetical protein
VLLTTHSLTMLYELNNLVTAAHMLPITVNDQRVPAPEFRIPASKVAAYMFQEDGLVLPLMQQQNLSLEDEAQRQVPWLNEDQLRRVDEELGQELSRIRAYGTFWKE